jgi:Flp pilus assembly pilin Flp
VRNRGRSFWIREEGQDVVEYALLLAFVCLAGAAMFVAMRGETSTIWQNVNTHLAAANSGS